ncbi:hypothetical protein C8R44DRAFT_893984 [Mycena epipterygia]|nr:hypothetical protein C8R44DRAFT_893984 [Mycena epipterygia]
MHSTVLGLFASLGPPSRSRHPPGTSSLSPCALNCITLAALGSSCLSLSNTTCICTDVNFQAMASSCLMNECQAPESGPAFALQSQECSAASLTSTAMPTATAPFIPPNPAADISSSAMSGASGAASGASSGAPGASGASSGASGPSSSGNGSGSGAVSLVSGKAAGIAATAALFGGLIGAVVVL